jgi:hypothetical protein
MMCSACLESGTTCALCLHADALTRVIAAGLELEDPAVSVCEEPKFILADLARALFAENEAVQAFVESRAEGRSVETRLRAEEVAWERDENGWATDSIRLAYKLLRRLGVES